MHFEKVFANTSEVAQRSAAIRANENTGELIGVNFSFVLLESSMELELLVTIFAFKIFGFVVKMPVAR